MTQVYSTRFYGGQIVAAGETVLYTVPSGSVAVVRDISLTNVTPTDTGQVVIYALIGAGNADIYRTPLIPTHGFQQWQGRQVVQEGESINLYAIDTTLRAMISGYLLALP